MECVTETYSRFVLRKAKKRSQCLLHRPRGSHGDQPRFDVLYEKRLGYQGMVYREATQQLVFYLDAKGYIPHAFIGFNALNNAEQQLFQEFLAHGGHYVFWDADSHFINDQGHSSSMFMRRYFKQWPYYETNSPLFIADNFSKPKNIEIIQTSTSLDQVKEIGQILKAFNPSDCQNTAIVLADEELLIPLLNSLPENIQKVVKI